MAKSKAPTGLAIKRSGNTFTFSWKIGDKDYGKGQYLWYRINGGRWNKPRISATATSYSVTNASVKTIAFQVAGKRKPYKEKKTTITPLWSPWAAKTWVATIPAVKSLSYSNAAANQGTFAWQVDASTDSTAIFTRVEAQTTYTRKTSRPTDAEFGSLMTKGASGSQTITEESEVIAAGNIVRWYRVRAVGNAGKSGWVYSSHAYGPPTSASLTAASAVTSGSASRITAQWNNAYNALRPIELLTLQYAIAVPTDSALTAPSSGWSDAIEIKPNGGLDKTVVNVDDTVGPDECMWVRIQTEYGGFSAYSNARVAQVGKLAAPTINAEPNTTTGRVSITITKETSCDAACHAIFFRAQNNPSNDRIVAVLPPGVTTTSITVPEIIGASRTCFGAYAFVGSYSDLVIKPVMRSDATIDSDIIAVAPANVTVSEGPREGTVRIGWEWSWAEAVSAELSWDEYAEAWESTDEPDTYTVTDQDTTSWVIADLDAGKRYYFRVRLIGEQDGEELPGPWSGVVTYNMSSVPDRPVLTLSKSVINSGDSVMARWAFSGSGGVEQEYAEICAVTYDENDEPVYDNIIAHVDAGQSVDIDYDWQVDTTYNLSVRVTTTSGMQTVWSDVASLYVAEPASIAISSSTLSAPRDYTIREDSRWSVYVDGAMSSFGSQGAAQQRGTLGYLNSDIYEDLQLNGTVDVDTEVIDEHTVKITTTDISVSPSDFEAELTMMPLTCTIIGAGETGTTILSIVRAEDYHIYRPDEKDYDGYAGETIATITQQGEGQITVNVGDLVGNLDDGARYVLQATVIDELGQTASLEIPFIVNWTHKAGIPSASVVTDRYQRITKITPIAPADAAATDTCDIYRLSADQPELIYKGATFGETYVDPYPAFGEAGGHRLVTVTGNGSYATENGIGWYDTGYNDRDILEEKKMIIDVNGDQIELPYNIELSNSWRKDFQRTQYLGGAVQGDWNPAVTRDLSARTVVLRGRDLDKILQMRDLADYAGLAHIRTADGSSMACDIQVSENMDYKSKRVSYSLTIQAIDPEEPEGMTLEEWEEAHSVQ